MPRGHVNEHHVQSLIKNPGADYGKHRRVAFYELNDGRFHFLKPGMSHRAGIGNLKIIKDIKFMGAIQRGPEYTWTIERKSGGYGGRVDELPVESVERLKRFIVRHTEDIHGKAAAEATKFI